MTEPPDLPLLHLRLGFRAQACARLPAFAGSPWRGAFGHALKRTVCVMRLRPCAGCPLAASCIYPMVFEAAPDEGAARLSRLERIAQPYVLMPPPEGPRSVAAGDPVELRLTLVGRAIGQRAYVLRAVEEAAWHGIGPDRVRLALERQAETASESLIAPPASGRQRIRFLTPLRLRREARLVTPDRLLPADLLMALVRRISMLATFHTDRPLTGDFRALRDRAAQLRWESCRLRWRELQRRSSRQAALLQMGGLVGEAELDMAGAASFAPFLRLLPWVGVGKGASMGLGQVELADAG
jgi:hypothetical protein